MKTIVPLSLFGLAMTMAAGAQDVLPLGTRVGGVDSRGVPAVYDDGGRRDPFANPIASKHSTASHHAPLQLSSLGMADVTVKGVLRSGALAAAILETPEGRSFVAHSGDTLHDAIVGRIDQNGVVFVAQVVDASGVSRSHDVRKSLRPSLEAAR